jgi:hypothetical protein
MNFASSDNSSSPRRTSPGFAQPGQVKYWVVRGFVLLLLGAAFAAQPPGQRGVLDPAFEKIPFDQWLGERDQAGFRWTASVPRGELSFHQRLMARVEIRLDGRDLDARRGDGRLVFLIQITDGGGTRYQDHGSLELGKLDENIRAAKLEYSQRAFFLPGDYRLAIAILDTATGEHSTRQAQFRVAPPQHDLLPDAWRDLPPVEFVGDEESPESWYLPDIRGRLQWAASVHSPVRLNVILNVAPSVPVPGSRRTQSGDLAALLPTLKALSQTGSSSLSEHVELLDLARRRAVFHQDEVHDLDWPRLKASLGEANTASIDIHSLSGRHQDAQFFVSRVRSLVRASEKSCVLVVLTKPVAFESGEDLEPVSLESLPACTVFYIRYRAPMQLVSPFGQQMGGRGRGQRMGGPMGRNRPPQDVVDQLEATLKPLSPKVFDVETPEQMTKAFAEIEKALLTSDGQSSR